MNQNFCGYVAAFLIGSAIGTAINFLPGGKIGLNTDYRASYDRSPVVLAGQTDEQFVAYTPYVRLIQDDEIGSTGSALTTS